VTPGRLPETPGLSPLARISPSRFTEFLDCALRECLAAAKTPRQLPSSPVARLGSAIHTLLEDAVAGQLPGTDAAAIRARFDALVEEQEAEMRESWLERHFAPLRESIGSFDERALQAVERAGDLSSRATSTEERELRGTGRRYGTELWVQTADGAVGGFIDLVEPSPSGPVISDYKTGSIRTREASLKPAYETQLKLYAAIYAEQHTEWPARLQLVTLSGERTTVPFTHAECEELLGRARALRDEVNAVVAAKNDLDGRQRRLASPSPSTCRLCSYRPSCRPYHEAAGSGGDPEAWPPDVWGRVTENQRLGNGRHLLRLSAGSVESRVRGLTPGDKRHPALRWAVPGAYVEAFGARLINEVSFDETAYTALYARPAQSTRLAALDDA
jgi:CRISPR/Cas system-associated exonuclease Cas4 (RecB family)